MVRTDVRGYPGVENPGQPLAGVHLECMSPPQAAAYLATRGYTHVLWQVDSGADSRPFRLLPRRTATSWRGLSMTMVS